MDEKEYIEKEIVKKEEQLEESENTRGMRNLFGILLTCLCAVGMIASFKAYLPIALILSTVAGASALTTFRNNGISREQSEKYNQEIDHLERIKEKGIDSSKEKQNKRSLKISGLKEEAKEVDYNFDSYRKEANIATGVAIAASLLTFASPAFVVLPIIALALGTSEGMTALALNKELQNLENRIDNLQEDTTISAIKEQNLAKKKKANPKLIRELPKLKSNTKEKEISKNSKAVDEYVESLENTEKEVETSKQYKKQTR